VILATTVSTGSALVIVGIAVLLCCLFVWDYHRICAEDTKRTREREATQVVPAFGFHIARRPVASTRSGRAAVTAGRPTHGGPRE
jgi:hypothetical protein